MSEFASCCATFRDLVNMRQHHYRWTTKPVNRSLVISHRRWAKTLSNMLLCRVLDYTEIRGQSSPPVTLFLFQPQTSPPPLLIFEISPSCRFTNQRWLQHCNGGSKARPPNDFEIFTVLCWKTTRAARLASRQNSDSAPGAPAEYMYLSGYRL